MRCTRPARGALRGGAFAALALLLAGVLAPAPTGADDGGFDFVDPRVVEMDPVDRKAPQPARTLVSGRLQKGYGAPAVIVIRPDGRAVIAPRLEWNEPAFRVEVELAAGRGTYRLEVLATTRGDLTHSGARWRVFSGVRLDAPDEPEPPDETVDPSVPTLLLEQRFFDLVNGHRRRAGLEPFAWLEPLGIAARAHAAACVKAGRVDHRVDGAGNVAQRLMRLSQWGDISYATPPSRPSPALGARSYVAAATDQRRSLDLILYRWQRFAAFCLPMTSENIPYAACGVARARSGDLFLVFAYAQMNAPRILADIETWPTTIAKDVAEAKGAERAKLLREWAKWRTDGARAEAKRRLFDPDPDLRAAAHDVRLLLDEEDERVALAREVASMRAAAANPERADAARAQARWISRLRFASPVAEEAATLLAELGGEPGPGSQPADR